MFEKLRATFRENGRLWMVVIAAFFTLVLIAWGAFTGFSLEFGRFFAAEPNTCGFANKDAPSCACAQNRSSACHVCTSSFQQGNTDYTDAQWFAWDSLSPNRCDAGCPAKFPYRTERTKLEGGSWSGNESCVEKPPDCPDSYHAYSNTFCEKDAHPVATPTPTSPPATATPVVVPAGAATLSVQCGALQNILTWTLVAGRNSNSILRNVDGANGTYVCGGPDAIAPCNNLSTATFTDVVSPGRRYDYTHKSCAPETCRSNTVTCPAVTPTSNPVLTPTPTQTAVASPTPSSTSSVTPSPTFQATPPPPSPQAGTLQCLPATQTIQIGQFSDHYAQGGDGQTYTWTALPGAVQESGATYFATYSWSALGTKRVTVASGGESSDCVVNVTGTGAVLVTKQARNESLRHVAFRNALDVREGQTIEFAISIGVAANSEAGPFRIADSFPTGLSYISGSARANGAAIADPFASPAGLQFGDVAVPSGTAVVVNYRAIADRMDLVPEGPQTAAYPVAVTDTRSGQTDAGAAVVLTLFGTGVGVLPATGEVGQIPTGPTDAIAFAFIIAAVTSLLYAAYTRSDAFRSREVRRIQHDQGPMDFRG